ncbi:MAG TPA: hypothetical protein VMJ90_07485 [Anaerolineales bacterium]|nr:hypothetical protein [Anaerolineales bacterium]
MTLHIVAVGQDVYWLTAVEKAIAGWAGKPDMLECPKELSECVSALPAPDANAVLLVDASGQNDMECTVALLRSRGWKYVIVVAADPSAKEAISVLRRNVGYDYWEKTYDENDIRERVRASFNEIEGERLVIKKKRSRTGHPRQRFE